MKSSGEFDELFEWLRSLAATDPRRARDKLCELLDSNSPHLEAILQKASSPGDGRLRQLIANTALVRGEQERFAAHFLAWQEVEADEFTKRALDAVLQGAGRSDRVPTKRPSLVERGYVDAYRYVSDRLKHQLRNALMDPLAQLIRLRSQVNKLPDDASRASLAGQVAALNDTLSRIGRIVEFDSGDGHFTVRPVIVGEWLVAFNDEYGRKYQPIRLRIEKTGGGATIRANDFLLGTVFWNLWINSQQAVGKDCAIDVGVACLARRVDLLIVDNGEGFPKEIGEAGFPDAKPRPGHRGRGLLEIQEAMERLHGEVSLVRHDDGMYRVRLSFPLEG